MCPCIHNTTYPPNTRRQWQSAHGFVIFSCMVFMCLSCWWLVGVLKTRNVDSRCVVVCVVNDNPVYGIVACVCTSPTHHPHVTHTSPTHHLVVSTCHMHTLGITHTQLVSRNAARLLFSNLRLQRWCFDVELIYLAEQYCMPLGEVSVNWTEIPGSKVKLMGVVLMAIELITVRLMYSILQLWQIRYAVGECVCLLGGCLTVWVPLQRPLLHTPQD